MRGLGTLVNVVAVVGGGGLGVALGHRLSERVRTTTLHGIGLLTLGVGADAFLDTHNAVFPIVAIVAGGVVGAGLRLEEHLESWGEALRRRADRPTGESSTFVTGFVTAGLTFCIGPLTVLGALRDGISGDSSFLLVKSALDGLVAIVYAAAWGIGVAFSALIVAGIQVPLTVLGAVAGSELLTDRMVDELTATGGVMILGIGLRLLDVKQVPVANYLPGLVLAPVAVALFAR